MVVRSPLPSRQNVLVRSEREFRPSGFDTSYNGKQMVDLFLVHPGFQHDLSKFKIVATAERLPWLVKKLEELDWH